MTASSPPPAPHSPQKGLTAAFARLTRGSEYLPEIDLREWMMNLWSGRLVILCSVLVFLALGAFSVWFITPTYQAEALVQFEPPKAGRDTEAIFARLGNLFSATSEGSTEIEIIGSNTVLSRTVQSLNLDIVAQPVLFPLIGEALVRGRASAPRADVDTFELPDSMRGLTFQLKALPDGSVEWTSPADPPSLVANPEAGYPQGARLATGRPGDVLVGTYGGETLKLKLRRLIAKPGQKFQLVRRPMVSAIKDLRNDLTAQVKSTNLLPLTFRHSNPAKATEILNEVMKQYIFLNAQRQGEEIARTLDFLRRQAPEIKTKLDLAENRLNAFRAQKGSVDIPKEAELVLQQNSGLTAQISALKQKKEELLRIYQEDSDVVSTLNTQISKLQGEASTLNQKLKALPGTQQEFVRLSRDVQVNTELYTALLNNIQHLQVTQAVEGPSTRVVDVAMAGLKPVKPKKEMLIAVSLVMGLFVGFGLALGRRAFRQAMVEDHRVIEAKLGLPVFVTIPHSKHQEKLDKAISLRLPGSHLLALQDPDDLTTESFRSLRTMLNFTMGDSPNRAIMITGPSPKVGKSFICSNFSVVLAQTVAKVLVVDADMRRGNLHKYFGLGDRLGGLSEVIAGLRDWKSAIRQTGVPGLQVMSSGEIPNNPAELLMSAGFANFLAEASEEYDYVLIDAPPLLAVTDATIIGSLVDTVLLVAKFGQHPIDELLTCQRLLETSRIPLKGCIFNDLMPTGIDYYDQHYRYAYHYKYSKADNS